MNTLPLDPVTAGALAADEAGLPIDKYVAMVDHGYDPDEIVGATRSGCYMDTYVYVREDGESHLIAMIMSVGQWHHPRYDKISPQMKDLEYRRAFHEDTPILFERHL